MRRLLLALGKGLWWLFAAALAAAYFLPQRLNMHYRPPSPELDAYYAEKRQKRYRYLARRLFEKWQQNENHTRTEKAWKNRNDFYK